MTCFRSSYLRYSSCIAAPRLPLPPLPSPEAGAELLLFARFLIRCRALFCLHRRCRVQLLRSALVAERQ